MSRRYLQLDVFADRPGVGNPLAVVLDAEGLDDAAMQAIARWTRLPETTFVFPPTAPDASYALRMFSPQREVPFAGHPSVGTAHAVLEAGLAQPVDGHLVQEGVAGLLPLRVRGAGAARTIAIRTPRARVAEVADADDARLADALAGLARGALPPVLMDGGRRWWLAELADEATLRSAAPDWAAIERLAQGTGSMGLCVFARSDDPVRVRPLPGVHFTVADEGLTVCREGEPRAECAFSNAWVAAIDVLKRDLFSGAQHALQAPTRMQALQAAELDSEDVAVEDVLDEVVDATPEA
mgnify:CR=1 FL=1